MPRLLIFLALFCTAAAAADQRSVAQAQLKTANRDIAVLKKQLEQIAQEKSSIYQDLRKSEKEMARLHKQVDDLARQLVAGGKELARLRARQEQLRQASAQQRELIAIQARAAYQSGAGQEYFKLLLNQENPQSFSRTLTYYDYLSNARFRQIAAFNNTFRELAGTELAIRRQTDLLKEDKRRLDGRQRDLAQAQNLQKNALARLNSQQDENGQRLKARRQEQAQLDQVLKTIEETLARRAREAQRRKAQAQAQARDRAAQRAARNAGAPQIQSPSPPPGEVAPDEPGGSGQFAGAHGRLPWPVKGRLVARFGAPRGDDPRSTWDGVLIDAPQGATVRAVSSGQVVFADWLRGLGLLIILDHGDGYLSLYGHTQRLLKGVGDRVEAGEPIATVGSSGGLDITALYFAIRQQGRPSDPMRWCRAQG